VLVALGVEILGLEEVRDLDDAVGIFQHRAEDSFLGLQAVRWQAEVAVLARLETIAGIEVGVEPLNRHQNRPFRMPIATLSRRRARARPG